MHFRDKKRYLCGVKYDTSIKKWYPNMIFERKKYLEELVGARINLIKNYFLQARFLLFDDLISRSKKQEI